MNDRTLSLAVADAILARRKAARVRLTLLEPLRVLRYRQTGLSLKSVQESAMMVGWYIDTREGFLEWAAAVAERLPSSVDETDLANLARAAGM